MTDHDHLTPPNAQPLSEDRRRALRAQLLTSAASPPATPTRRWLAPGLAAAAVLTIVGVGAIATDRFDNSAPTGSVRQLPPAAGGTAPPLPPDPTDQQTMPTPQASPTSALRDALTEDARRAAERQRQLSGVSETGATEPSATASTAETMATSCEDEVELLDEPRLRGASVTAERGYGPGTTYLYETKSAWVVCDNLSASDGGAPTLFSPHDKSRPYEPSTTTLAISQNVIAQPNSDLASTQFVAAGRDFDGIQAISYAFPDGHTEDAAVDKNGLWSMTYLLPDERLEPERERESARADRGDRGLHRRRIAHVSTAVGTGHLRPNQSRLLTPPPAELARERGSQICLRKGIAGRRRRAMGAT